MKLHLTTAENQNLITAFSADAVTVNHQPYTHSLVVLPEKILAWPVAYFEAIRAEDFALILPFKPEVVLLGTGQKHRFIHPKLTALLSAQNIPLECMTTAAACRTYNILMSEGRIVAAILMLNT